MWLKSEEHSIEGLNSNFMLGKQRLEPLIWIKETFSGLNLFHKLLLSSRHWACQSLGKQRQQRYDSCPQEAYDTLERYFKKAHKNFQKKTPNSWTITLK